MKRLTTTLGILILTLGACGGGMPAHASPQCKHLDGAYYCLDMELGTYYVRMFDGETLEGQCNSGARWTDGVPFLFANRIHTSMCGAGLEYVR